MCASNLQNRIHSQVPCDRELLKLIIHDALDLGGNVREAVDLIDDHASEEFDSEFAQKAWKSTKEGSLSGSANPRRKTVKFPIEVLSDGL